MPKIITVTNPQNPQDGLAVRDVKPCSLGQAGEKFRDEPWLAVVYLDGKRYFPLREEWDDVQLQEGDVVYFMPHVGGVVTAIIIAIVAKCMWTFDGSLILVVWNKRGSRESNL